MANAVDDPNDWVRIETAAALRRNVLVIPVLVDGARLPDPASLPEELRPLCQRHACELTDSRWSYDVGELVKDLEKIVRPPKKFEIFSAKDKRLRWLAGSVIVLALLLGMALFGPTVLWKAPKAKRVNLFASENGGHVLAASSDDWVRTINGDESETGIGVGTGRSAVFAFKDERLATFDMFTMLIPGTHDSNVKEFQLLQGNESPTGPFEPIGKFQTQNTKLFNTPYQEFKFSPVTAKYLKVTILSAYAFPFSNVYQIQLFGVLQ